jgi:hypothetical protein
MSAGFRVTIHREDWDPNLRAWRCQALAIPGATVTDLYDSGKRIDPNSYRVDRAQLLIRWVHGTAPSDSASLVLALTEHRAMSASKAVWQGLAVVWPFMSAIIWLR